jgi:ribose/xylose/arabinose/galactoside ABC-type transport system permease subunit
MKRPGSLHLNRRVVNNLILVGLLFVLVIFFSAMNPRFFSVRNFINVTRQILPIVLMGCAMTFVINSGAIDLSVGGVMALSAVLFATFVTWGVGVWVALLMVILLGLLVGAINTFIVSGLKIPAIMATMATWIMCNGLAYILCRSIPVRDTRMKPIFEINSKIFFHNTIPLALFILVAVVAAFLFLEKRTILGKYAISIGGNENAAVLSGINVPRMRLIFYVLTGAMAAFSGVWQVARIGSGDPTIGTGMEFAVIAGCILGGVNIKGGEGTITGMLLGTIILALLTNGMNMMGVNAFYQQVATGIVLLVAILITFAVPYARNRIRMAPRVAYPVATHEGG